MAKNWWKILAAFLVIYATVFSFFKPLEPALFSTDVNSLSVGKNSVKLTGYNTNFKDASSSNYIFLKGTSFESSLCVQEIEIQDNNHLSFSVEIPRNLKDKTLEVHMSNDKDGPMFLPGAFNVVGTQPTDVIQACEVKYVKGAEEAFRFPYRVPDLYETIRNLLFHVPMWFSMFVLMAISLVASILYLATGKKVWDLRAGDSAKIALLFCILGLITGSIWARFSWGDWWTADPRLNGSAGGFLLLCAYIILRRSAAENPNGARIAAVYNIISFFMIMALIMVLPRLMPTLHPGQDGNPAFSSYDLDDNLRMVFYPACAGWIMTSIWIYTLRVRISKLKHKIS